MSPQDDAKALLALTASMINATASVSVPEMDHCFSRLAKKMLYHGMSTLQVSEGYSIQIAAQRIRVLDFASAFVLARASCETYITYELLDEAKSDPDLFEFRYCAWTYADIRERQDFPTFTDEERNKKAQEATEMASLLSRIKATAYYKGLASVEKRSVRTGFGWHPGDSLTKLIAGLFGPDVGGIVYPLLCSFAHAGSLSAAQVEEVKDPSDQRDAMELALLMTMKVIALTNGRYAARFPEAEGFLKSSGEEELNDGYAKLIPVNPGT